MIICICADISANQLTEFLKDNKSLSEIQRETNAGLGCGRCSEYLKSYAQECDEDNHCRNS